MTAWRAWGLAAALALAAGAAVAQGPADGVVEQLRAQGYEEFEVSRTLLGRIRVVALGPEGRREIVFIPATGEILRDYVEAGDGGTAPRIFGRWDGPEGDGGGDGEGNSGRGGGDDDDDDGDDDDGRDDDDRDDDDRDDDHSGRGGGNSGPGGGG